MTIYKFQADSSEPKKDGSAPSVLGIGGGAVIGLFAGGPVGALLGGTAGYFLGHWFAAERAAKKTGPARTSAEIDQALGDQWAKAMQNAQPDPSLPDSVKNSLNPWLNTTAPGSSTGPATYAGGRFTVKADKQSSDSGDSFFHAPRSGFLTHNGQSTVTVPVPKYQTINRVWISPASASPNQNVTASLGVQGMPMTAYVPSDDKGFVLIPGDPSQDRVVTLVNKSDRDESFILYWSNRASSVVEPLALRQLTVPHIAGFSLKGQVYSVKRGEASDLIAVPTVEGIDRVMVAELDRIDANVYAEGGPRADAEKKTSWGKMSVNPPFAFYGIPGGIETDRVLRIINTNGAWFGRFQVVWGNATSSVEG